MNLVLRGEVDLPLGNQWVVGKGSADFVQICMKGQ